jgi:diguanylate cyclase (GGDEF)-like protein/PAS domain S-box-containing protein
MKHPSTLRFAPATLLIALMAMILLVDAGVTYFIHAFGPTERPLWIETLANAVLLGAGCAPFLWVFFLRPLKTAYESEALRMRAIMDTAGEAIITTDERGLVRDFNRSAETIFGYRAEEMVGQNIGLLMPAPQREAHDGHFRAHLQDKGAGMIGKRRLVTGLRKDGTPFPLEIALSETRIGDRRMFTGIIHDISDFKAAEAALARSNELLERIFGNIHSMIAYMDHDFDFIRVNRAYAAADGREPEFFPGRNHFELYPNAENEAIFRRVVETGEPYLAYAKRFEYPDQPERGVSWWDWGLYPVKRADGRVEALLLDLDDVTQRELAESERLRAVARFHTLFNHATDAIFIHDREGHFLEVNLVACERLGYSREELLKLTPQDIDTNEYAALVGQRLAELEQRGELVFESAHMARDGRVIPVEISSRVIDYQGQPAILGTARDITARKAMAAALHEAQENQQALLNATTQSAMLVATSGDILSLNEPAAAHFKQIPEDLAGRNLFDLWPAEVAPRRREFMVQATRYGAAVHFQDQCFGRVVEVAFYPVRGTAGAVERIAIYSTDVTDQTRLRGIEALLHEVDERTLAGAPLAELSTFICARVADLFGLALAWIGEKAQDGTIIHIAGAGPATGYQEEIRHIGVRWDETATGRGTTGSAIRLGKTQVMTVTDAAFGPWRETAQHHGLAAICAIPLIVRGHIYGAATLYSASSDSFRDPTLLQQLENIASRISVALETQLDQNRLRLLSAALATASNAVFITDRHGRIEWVNEAFIRLSGYTAAEAIGQTPRFLKSGEHGADYYRALWDTIMAGHTWRSQTTEKRKDGSFYTVRQVITPIANGGGEIEHFISMHEDITEQLDAQARIEHLAHYDALTGLPNRSLFFDRLSQAIALSKRSSEHIALFFLDLDRFKPVNDTYGHAVGDLLLKAVAERMLACVRESDTVARIAGDEFTVILNRIAERADVAHVAEKIIKALSEPFQLEGHVVQIGASIGIAIYPGDSQNEHELVKLADTAMYDAKNQGRNAYRFHS